MAGSRVGEVEAGGMILARPDPDTTTVPRVPRGQASDPGLTKHRWACPPPVQLCPAPAQRLSRAK
jgi:hypothetical protein